MTIDTADVRGGTNRPGIPPDAFAMPAGKAMRYDVPAPAIRDYVSGYAIYVDADRRPMVNWFLPAPAMICIVADAGPVSIDIGRSSFGPLARASLYGPTSRAYRASTAGGFQVGVGITPLGWARMIAAPANRYHNVVVPLATVVGTNVVDHIVASLDGLTDETAIAPLMDKLLAPLFTHEHPYQATIRHLSQLLVTDGVIEIADVAARLDLPQPLIRRLSTQVFGMPPKLLLRRARFLRSFVALLADDAPMSYDRIDSSYYDLSHFLRDAKTFLGTTPRRFMAQDTTYLRASLRARAATIGAPVHALHATPPAIAAQPNAA